MPTPGLPRSPHTRTALAVLGVCLLMNVIGRGVADTYVVFLLPLEKDLGWTRTEMASVYSIYLLVNGLIAPVVGLMFDRIGPRIVYGVGMACLGLGYLLASRVQTLWQFYATVGAITGFAVAALGMVPSSSMIARWFRERLSTAISIAFAGLGLGALLIVPSVQVLLQNVGWREAYQYIGLALLCLVPPTMLLPWKTFVDGHPDYRQTSRQVAEGVRDWTVRAAMGTRMFWGLVWVFFFTSVGMFSITVQTVVYLVERGFSPIVAATAFGMASMLSVFGIVTTGAIADKFGPRLTASWTYAGSISGIGVLLAMTWFPIDGLLFAYVVLFGLCQGARGPLISAMSTRLFAGSHVASIYGVIYASNAFGAGLGALMSGVLHDVAGSYRPGFVFSIFCLLLASLPFWHVPEIRNFHMRPRAA